MTDWSAVGGDPAPGDPGAIQQVAARDATLAGVLHDVTQVIGGLGNELSGLNWTGSGADSVRNRISTALPPLIRLWDMYQEASTALGGYATNLEGWQSQAARLLEEFESIKAEFDSQSASASSAQSEAERLDIEIAGVRAKLLVAQANPLESGQQISALQDHLRSSESAVSDARDRQRAANGARDDASRRLAAIRNSLDSIREDHDAAADATANAIYNAAGLTPPSSNPLVRITGDVIADYNHFIGSDDFTIFLQSCNKVSGYVGDVAFVAGFIPGAQPIALALTASALALEAVSVAGHTARAAAGDESWHETDSELPGFALSALSLGGGAMASRLTSESTSIGGFDNVLGDAKRAVWYDDARQATTGFFHNDVHVVPKLDLIPPALGRTYMTVLTVVKGADDVHSAYGYVKDAYQLDSAIGRRLGSAIAGTPIGQDL